MEYEDTYKHRKSLKQNIFNDAGAIEFADTKGTSLNHNEGNLVFFEDFFYTLKGIQS